VAAYGPSLRARVCRICRLPEKSDCRSKRDFIPRKPIEGAPSDGTPDLIAEGKRPCDASDCALCHEREMARRLDKGCEI
jgi:hypothetical protein